MLLKQKLINNVICEKTGDLKYLMMDPKDPPNIKPLSGARGKFLFNFHASETSNRYDAVVC